MPLDIREWVEDDDLCWFVADTTENLDLSGIYAYDEDPQPA